MPILNEIAVTLAREEDAPRIVSFLSAPEVDKSFLYPLSRRNISISERVYSKFPSGFWLVALYQGEIVGCRGCNGLVDEKDKVVEFSTTAVSPLFQGIGLGNLLVRRGVEIALERYTPLTMRFDSWANNLPIERIALKNGFVKTRIFDDPLKRPPGMQSVEYLLDCSKFRH